VDQRDTEMEAGCGIVPITYKEKASFTRYSGRLGWSGICSSKTRGAWR